MAEAIPASIQLSMDISQVRMNPRYSSFVINVEKNSLKLIIRANRNLILFELIAFLIYSIRNTYSLWFDEAATLSNATHYSISQINSGLSWIQSAPPGYMYLSKLCIFLTGNEFLLRSISSLSILIASVIGVKIVKMNSLNSFAPVIFLLGFLFNPISMTFASMAKPYALEVLFTAIVLYKYKDLNNRKYLQILICGTFFASGFLIPASAIYLSSVITKINPAKSLLWLTPSALITFFFAQISNPQIKDFFLQVWYPLDNLNILQKIKSAIGAAIWLPISCFGLGKEEASFFGAYWFSAIICLTLGILALTLFRRTYSNEFSKLIGISLLIIFATMVLFGATRQYPLAGRLYLGSAIMIWIFLSISSSNRSSLRGTVALILLSISVTSGVSNIFDGPRSNIKQLVIENTEISNKQIRFFGNIWALPGLDFYSRNHRFHRKVELIEINPVGQISNCGGKKMPQGAIVFIDNISKSQIANLSSFNGAVILDARGRSAILRLTRSIEATSINSANIYCNFYQANPTKPLRNPDAKSN